MKPSRNPYIPNARRVDQTLRNRVFDLRTDGLTWREIGKAVHRSPGMVRNLYLHEVLKRFGGPQYDPLRELGPKTRPVRARKPRTEPDPWIDE